jgi:tetratricopeptide (TPR) repeat protein
MLQDQLAQVRMNADQIRAQVENFNFTGRGPGRGPRRGDDGLYSSGQRALDRSQWDEALSNFNRVVSNAGPRAEGALYWKAYTLNKLGRRDEARAAIADLRKMYPMSRWLDDANALDMEIQQAAGRSVSPENQPDEELKLMALNALVRSDPDRALPLLENLLKSAQTPRLKERALFVLSQTDSPRAQQMLEQVARGGGNPDLQVTAITYLGAISRRKGNSQPLYDIYAATSDVNVKRALLQALRSAGDTDHIMQAVKSEKSPELRAEGIRLLGAKADAGDTLVAMWATETDQQVKYAILDSLNGQRNAKALVDLARKEKDPQMKKEIVRRLSNMESKEATDYLMEILK